MSKFSSDDKNREYLEDEYVEDDGKEKKGEFFKLMFKYNREESIYDSSDKDSREESESVFGDEPKYSLKNPCRRCRKLYKKSLSRNFNIDLNQNSNNNNNPDDYNDIISNTKRSSDGDSIENNLLIQSYKMKDKKISTNEGLMYFKNFNDKTDGSKFLKVSVIKDDNNNNNLKTNIVPGKFVKSRENLTKIEKTGTGFEKGSSFKNKNEHKDNESDRFDEKRKSDDTKKENKFTRQQILKKQSPQKQSYVKPTVKFTSPKNFSNASPDEPCISSEDETENNEHKLERDIHEEFHTPIDQGNIDFYSKQISKGDSACKEKNQKLLESNAYCALKDPDSSNNCRKPSQGDAYLKQPSKSILSRYNNLYSDSDSFEVFGDSIKNIDNVTRHYHTDSYGFLYGLSATKGVIIATLIAGFAFICMNDLCQE